MKLGRRQQRKPAGRADSIDVLLGDVQNLAEVASDTVFVLDRAGMPEYARPLKRALVRLGR